MVKYLTSYFVILFSLLIVLSCNDNNPSSPDISKIEMTGNWIPSTTNLKEYSVTTGSLLIDTTYSLYDFMTKWNTMKYVKVDSNMISIYTVYKQSNDTTVYVDTTKYTKGGDSIKIRSSFHGTDSIRTEYIIREGDRLFITADCIVNENPNFRAVWKTKLETYIGSLPDPGWPKDMKRFYKKISVLFGFMPVKQ